MRTIRSTHLAMLPLFLVSFILLAGVFVTTFLELSSGQRVGGNVRRMVDRRLRMLYHNGKRGFKRLLDLIGRDVLIKGLHMVTYLMLVLVRGFEHRLARLVLFLRSFRRRGSKKKPQDLLENTQDAV